MTMGGYVTQSRRPAGRRPGDHYSWSNNDWRVAPFERDIFPLSTGNSHYWGHSTQTTSSYRSGGSEVEDESVLSYLHGGNLASSTRAIRSQDRNRKTKHDTGHTFSTETRRVTPSSFGWDLSQWDGNQWWYYKGPLAPQPRNAKYSTIATSFPELYAWGTKAISDTIPTSSPADLAEALIELLREGLPSIPGRVLAGPGSAPSKVGGEYLNSEFGIKPILRDMRSTLHAIVNSKEILAKYEAGGGTVQHRQRHFPIHDETVVEYDGTGILSGWPDSNVRGNFFIDNGQGHLTQTLRVYRKIYFKGAYTYFVPWSDLSKSRLVGLATKAEYLLGLELSLEVLWEVMPWSWLADWVWNIGDNISNATRLTQDGLVLRYGYIMKHELHERTYTLSKARRKDGSTIAPCSLTYSTESKHRVRATPYGFGLNPASFSGRKWAILGALGMTKGNNSLRLNE